jgi:hypothetical protein
MYILMAKDCVSPDVPKVSVMVCLGWEKDIVPNTIGESLHPSLLKLRGEESPHPNQLEDG